MTLEWLERDGVRIVVRQQFDGPDPDAVWRLWTEPEALTRWWPDEAEVDARGRSLHLSWPRMDWHLRGRILEWQPPRRLVFTWHWDHEPTQPVRTVAIDLASLDDREGTELTLAHGDYGDGEAEAADRQSHLDGWDFFLPRLAAAAEPERAGE
jgi:uncharacterized protein YndB with AHSA1/START domain